MANIKATENEFRSQVIFWLNKFFEQGGYSFQIATSDPSVAGEGNALFPDVPPGGRFAPAALSLDDRAGFRQAPPPAQASSDF